MKPEAARVQQEIAVRPFRDFREMDVCVSLQQRVWGYSDVDVVPANMFVVAAKAGGQVLGAFHGKEAIGFSLGYPAVRDGRVFLFSHMLAVLPEYQDRGV